METQIIKKLSGTEVTNALCHSFRKMLEGDDRLAGHMSYAIVKWNIKLSVRTPQDIPEGLEREIEGVEGDPTSDDPFVQEIELEVEQEQAKSPNEIRHDSLQPIPVLVTDEKGQTTEKYISYANESDTQTTMQKVRAAKKTAAPKGGFGAGGYGT